jgi:hypothetical protein
MERLLSTGVLCSGLDPATLSFDDP